MKINETVKEIHEYAKSKGWWDGKERSALEIHMLCVSEIAEATEEVRNGKPDLYQISSTSAIVTMEDFGNTWDPNGKPEGERIELVDCIIRMMDYYGRKGWDLEHDLRMKMDYNMKRPYRHGGKKY